MCVYFSVSSFARKRRAGIKTSLKGSEVSCYKNSSNRQGAVVGDSNVLSIPGVYLGLLDSHNIIGKILKTEIDVL